MTVYSIDGEEYRLPDRLDEYQLRMYTHLIRWKWRHITREPGIYVKQGQTYEYDAILPRDFARETESPHLYEPIRPHLAAHRVLNDFRIHPHFHHMSSSQAGNINLFLPILHHPLAAQVFRAVRPDFAALATDQLDRGYCLEYWGGNFDTPESLPGLLGDKSRQAGTDADIAIAYRNHDDKLCLWLIEHKLTEAEFTTCGGAVSRGKDPARHDCSRSLTELLQDESRCYYADKCNYKYWDITKAHAGLFSGHAEHEGCPFKGGLNQLWRNQVLALAIEDNETQPYQSATFSVVKHPGNGALDKNLNAYRRLIGENAAFSILTSDRIVAAAEQSGDAELTKWASWYRDLYNLPE